MKQITQTRFKKGQVEFENISSPETDATNTRIVSLSVNQYGEFQFTTDGEHYTAIEPKILPITSIETIYQDESDLPASQTEGTILPAYSNGSLPIKLYQTQNQQWVEINEVQEYLFYLPLDTKILYTFLNGVFTSVGITKTSELTNDAQFLTPSDISSLVTQVGTNTSDIQTNANAITSINQKIPSEASSSNQLADKAFVNSSIQTQTAHFRGNWSDWASVPTNVNDYPADDDGNKTPTSNDYMVVQDASGYTGQTLTGTWRFKYSGVWATNGKNGWLPEYQVNETPLTAQQIAALNSGANTTNIGQISTNTSDISALQSGKQDKITSTNKLSVDLVENAAKTNASNTFSAEQTFSANIKNSGTYYIGSSNAVLSSISGSALTLGDANATLNMVGSGTYPNYNGEPLAKKYETLDITGNTQFIRGLKIFYTDRPQVYINGSPDQVAVLGDIPTIPPIPTVNDPTITITQGGVTKGSFTLNQASGDTINLDAGGSSATDVQVDSVSITSNDVADIKTINGNYNASTNKFALQSDLPQVNNASLYLQLNGNAVKTFTANASSDVTANIQALPNYSLSIGSTNGGNPRQVLFTRVNYTNFDSNSGAYFKLGAMSGHGNGSSYTFVEDVFINVNYQGTVTCNVYKYVQQSVTLDGVTRNYGDIFWTIDTTNKIVDFYILLGQYSSAQFTPATKIGAAKAVTTANGITQYSGTPTYYSSGTKVWADGNGYLYATTSNSLNVTTLTADANLWDLDIGVYQGKGVKVYYGTYSGVAQSMKLEAGRTLFVGTKSTEVGAIYIGAGYVYEVKCALDGSTHSSNVLTTDGRVASSYLNKNMSGTITGNSDTPLTLKSNATASYLGFQNSSGTTLGYYGVNASNRPVFYYGSDHALAYTSDIPDLLSKVYPVGSIYLSVNNTSPASFLGGTWEQIGANYALWTATSGAGSTISAGLPNITGYFNDNGHANNGAATGVSGAFYNKSDNNAKSNNGAASDGYQIGFEASRSNSIYGNSSTVQPPAYKVYAWKRTA